MKNNYEIDMCNGPIVKKMLAFALPLMCSSILQLLFNAIDIVVVGRFAGDEAMAAVGATSSLNHLFVNGFIGLSIGVNVQVSKYRAAEKSKEVHETVHTAILLAAICGLILMVVGIMFAPVVLTWMDTPKEILNQSSVYVRTYFLGIGATLVYNFGAAVLRAIGDTKRPMRYLMCAGIVNVVLNLIFVIVFHWGVFGVAIATAISHMVSATLVIRCLMKEESMIRLELKSLRIYKDKMVKILKIGLPSGLQSSLFNLSNVTVQSSVNLFGATVVAGNSAASNIGGFIYAAMDSFSQASLTFTSQNAGAKKKERLTPVLLRALACVTVTGLTIGVGAYLAGPVLLGIYSNSTAVIEAGMVRLSIVATTYVMCGIMNVIVGGMRGLGSAFTPMIISLLGSCVFRIVWLKTVFLMPQFHHIEMVYIVYPLSWLLTISALVVAYIRLRVKVKKSA